MGTTFLSFRNRQWNNSTTKSRACLEQIASALSIAAGLLLGVVYDSTCFPLITTWGTEPIDGCVTGDFKQTKPMQCASTGGASCHSAPEGNQQSRFLQWSDHLSNCICSLRLLHMPLQARQELWFRTYLMKQEHCHLMCHPSPTNTQQVSRHLFSLLGWECVWSPRARGLSKTPSCRLNLLPPQRHVKANDLKRSYIKRVTGLVGWRNWSTLAKYCTLIFTHALGQ